MSADYNYVVHFCFVKSDYYYCLHNFTPPAFARSKFEFAPPKLLKVAESQATTTMHRWNGECDFIAAPFVSVSKGFKTLYFISHNEVRKQRRNTAHKSLRAAMLDDMLDYCRAAFRQSR